MRPGLAVPACIVATLLASVAAAQTAAPPADRDHAIVYELGWAGAWSRLEGWQTRGATVAFETTPIEHWLELESGVTALWSPSGTEWSIDLLVKKPWTLRKGVEFMAGVGPEVGHNPGGTFWGISVAGDFMFWPRSNVGWYLEPAYETDFPTAGVRRGFSMAAGLLLGR